MVKHTLKILQHLQAFKNLACIKGLHFVSIKGKPIAMILILLAWNYACDFDTKGEICLSSRNKFQHSKNAMR